MSVIIGGAVGDGPYECVCIHSFHNENTLHCCSALPQFPELTQPASLQPYRIVPSLVCSSDAVIVKQTLLLALMHLPYSKAFLRERVGENC